MSKVKEFYKNHIQRDIGLYSVIGSEFCNSWMLVSCKLLETSDPDSPIHPFQILFVRMVITYAVCILYVLLRNVENAPFGPKEVRWALVLRGFFGFFGVLGLYYPLMYLSVSDVIVIQFLAPTATALIAYLFLREYFTKLEALSGLISLGGVLLIAKPTFLFGDSANSYIDDKVESSDPTQRLIAILVSLVGVVSGASSLVTIRHIGDRADAVIMISYFALITAILSFFTIILTPSLSFKMPGSASQWGLLLLIGVSGFFMQFLMTFGVQYEKASRAASIMYVQIIFGIAWEFLIWHHLPNILSWLGIIIILSTSFCVFYFKKREDDDIPHRVLDEEEDFDSSVIESHEEFDIPMKKLHKVDV